MEILKDLKFKTRIFLDHVIEDFVGSHGLWCRNRDGEVHSHIVIDLHWSHDNQFYILFPDGEIGHASPDSIVHHYTPTGKIQTRFIAKNPPKEYKLMDKENFQNLLKLRRHFEEGKNLDENTEVFFLNSPIKFSYSPSQHIEYPQE